MFVKVVSLFITLNNLPMYFTLELINNVIFDPSTSSGQTEEAQGKRKKLRANGHNFRSS